MRSSARRGGAVVLLVLLPLAACGGLPRAGLEPPSAVGTATAGVRPAGIAPPGSTAAGTSSAAAELRATLTGLLVEHAYLLGATVSATVDAGGDTTAPAVRAAAATHDAASVALADALAAGYPRVRADFLSSWRGQAAAAVGLAVALGRADGAAADAARAALLAHPARVGSLLAGAVPGLPAGHVSAALTPATTALVRAVEAAAAGRPDAVLRLRAFAAPLAVLAAVIAQGITLDSGLEGRAGSAAAALRATLTALLVEHVHLVAAAARSGRGGAAALDGNAQALATAVAGVAPGLRPGLLAAWRAHTQALVRYAARGGGDAARALDDTRAGVGRSLDGAGTLTGAAVAAELEPATATLVAALDAQAAGGPGVPDRVRKAGRHAAVTAAYLSSGLLSRPGG